MLCRLGLLYLFLQFLDCLAQDRLSQPENELFSLFPFQVLRILLHQKLSCLLKLLLLFFYIYILILPLNPSQWRSLSTKSGTGILQNLSILPDLYFSTILIMVNIIIIRVFHILWTLCFMTLLYIICYLSLYRYVVPYTCFQ